MGGRKPHFEGHPYYVLTDKWPPPGYDGLGDAPAKDGTKAPASLNLDE